MILKMSKFHMFELHYGILHPYYGEDNLILLLMVTDYFFIAVQQKQDG